MSGDEPAAEEAINTVFEQSEYSPHLLAADLA